MRQAWIHSTQWCRGSPEGRKVWTVSPVRCAALTSHGRFCNIDYIVIAAFATLFGKQPKHPLLLSYDIACQWAVNFLRRLKEFPEHLQIELPVGELRFAIPKYHFNGHKEKDHTQYSLNLMPGAGRTDGEEIERTWPRHDGTATSTREMGPGFRHDTLEDHFGFGNWQKLVGLGTST